jgi:endonuclease YncB( thermonuclease family)
LPDQPVPPAEFDLTATLVEVIDGDTVGVDDGYEVLQLRLFGINAPEQGECYASEARAHLKKLTGQSVSAELLGTELFGRTLAYLWDDGTLVNLDLVTRGLAIASNALEGIPPERMPHVLSLLQAEEAAYTKRLGLWSPDACGGGPLPQLEIDPGKSEPNPPGPDEDALNAEIVVIVNRGDKPVALEGWALRDESSRHRYHFPSGTVLAPDEIFTVSSDLPGWDPGGSPVWNNSGDMALLLDPAGRVVSRWRYGPRSTGP